MDNVPDATKPPDDLEITRSFLALAYCHDPESAAPHAKRWGEVLVAILLIISIFYFKPMGAIIPDHANWIWWLATAARLVIILWLIARGVLHH